MDFGVKFLSGDSLNDDDFSQLVSDAEITSRKLTRVPKRTRYANSWAIGTWKKWAIWRNEKMSMEGSTSDSKFEKVPLLDVDIVSEEELGYWLTRFVLEVRREDKKPYPPETLWNICCGIQRYVRQFKCSLHIFNELDANFVDFYQCLDSRMKELSSDGIGMKKKRAEPITKGDEKQLWDTSTISLDSSSGLLNGVFLYGCKIFGLRSVDEHRHLTAEQFNFSIDPESCTEVLTFHGKTCKTNQGGIKDRHVEEKIIEQYADEENDRCVVKLFKKYLGLIPKNGSFYRRAMKELPGEREPRFSTQCVGVNTLKMMIKKMFEEAGIPTEGRNITNHSGKVTCATNLFMANFDDKMVRSRTGHTSDALQTYKRPSKDMEKKGQQSFTTTPKTTCDINRNVE